MEKEKEEKRKEGGRKDFAEPCLVLALCNIYPQIHKLTEKMLYLSYKEINFQ